MAKTDFTTNTSRWNSDEAFADLENRQAEIKANGKATLDAAGATAAAQDKANAEEQIKSGKDLNTAGNTVMGAGIGLGTLFAAVPVIGWVVGAVVALVGTIVGGVMKIIGGITQSSGEKDATAAADATSSTALATSEACQNLNEAQEASNQSTIAQTDPAATMPSQSAPL